MSWLEDTQLRDLEDGQMLEACCLRCTHTWMESPTRLLLKVLHRDVYLDEVARSLPCPRPGCRHTGVRLSLVRTDDTSGFVGGMP
ncbi:hypothetical protein [Hyphomonas pacifica]|uniref:Uncharacterized protein n=1 Tax=Hyphomonas pacifica TaxID=1280941 RepID=A0A8B2PH00_9PROT|nr:hypothetical protein [Hyphomonas pacifica]RAN30610.1 hypothetical protein HY3_05530 [Hyphomonas pacifica]